MSNNAGFIKILDVLLKSAVCKGFPKSITELENEIVEVVKAYDKLYSSTSTRWSYTDVFSRLSERHQKSIDSDEIYLKLSYSSEKKLSR